MSVAKMNMQYHEKIMFSLDSYTLEGKEINLQSSCR